MIPPNENETSSVAPSESDEEGPFSPLLRKLAAAIGPLGRYLDEQAANPTSPFRLPTGQSKWNWLILPIWLLLLLLLAGLKWFAIALAICIPLFAVVFLIGWSMDVTGIDTLIATVYPFVLLGTPVVAPLSFILARKLTENGPSKIANAIAMFAAVLVVVSIPVMFLVPLAALVPLLSPYLGDGVSEDVVAKIAEVTLALLTAYLITKPWRWSLRKTKMASAAAQEAKSAGATTPA